MRIISFNYRVCGGVLLLYALFAFISCTRKAESNSKLVAVLNSDTICSGDILLRRGMGLTSRMVLAADLSGNYSHAGIAVEYNGEIAVVHSVPDEAPAGEPEYVKLESLEDFFSPLKSNLNFVLRTPLSPDSLKIVVDDAMNYYDKRVTFDHKYSLADDEKLYCSELVFLAFNKVGFDVTNGRFSQLKSSTILGRVILPADIEHNPNLEVICEF